MGLIFEHVEGQTPINEDEMNGLLHPHITLQSELNEFEQRNIQKAEEWILSSRFKKEQILTVKFTKMVHKRMFGDVWRWAGSQRNRATNIGVDWESIPFHLKQLIDNCSYWIEHQVFPPDEIAIRFKHEIVRIHCFPNGNGRHSRLMADIIIRNIFQQKMFTWRGNSLQKNGSIREEYLDAVRKADQGDLQPLISFARS
jgi:Fic-DOC domain mobile mystery protein B